MLSTDLMIVAADPLSAIRTGLIRAEDQLRAGAWEEAEQTLRAALTALDGARTADCAASFASGGLTPNQQRRLVRHIDDHIAAPISLPDLADVARLSPSHFCRMFRSSFGLPPLHYVQRRRAERAMTLMLTTNEALASIALECGLYDQAALCKVFRRVTGQSPAAWRRQRRS